MKQKIPFTESRAMRPIKHKYIIEAEQCGLSIDEYIQYLINNNDKLKLAYEGKIKGLQEEIKKLSNGV